MAMKVVDVKTEKVFDGGPNTYLKRAEEKLKIGQYDEALKDARLAVECSENNHQKVLEQYNKIKDALNFEKTIIVCRYCSQKMRVPKTKSGIVVTCPKCNKEFSYCSNL